jgi:hypothetical protein
MMAEPFRVSPKNSLEGIAEGRRKFNGNTLNRVLRQMSF